MTLAHGSRELNDDLHALNLTFDRRVEVLLFHLWEQQEVNGTSIASLGILRDERPQGLVDVLGQERRVRRLKQPQRNEQRI